MLLDPESLLNEWNFNVSGRTGKEDKNKKMLETTEKLVYSCLGLYPKNVDRLVEETKLGAGELLNILVSLELQGYIREISKNYYIKVK